MVIIAGASAVLLITGTVKWLLLFRDWEYDVHDSKSTISITTNRMGYWILWRIYITLNGKFLLPNLVFNFLWGRAKEQVLDFCGVAPFIDITLGIFSYLIGLKKYYAVATK